VKVQGFLRLSCYQRIIYAQHVERDGKLLFGEVCESTEGMVCKRKASVYAEHGWLKVRNPHYTQVEGRHEMFTAFRERSRTKSNNRGKMTVRLTGRNNNIFQRLLLAHIFLAIAAPLSFRRGVFLTTSTQYSLLCDDTRLHASHRRRFARICLLSTISNRRFQIHNSSMMHISPHVLCV
jgi:hypothetical protein